MSKIKQKEIVNSPRRGIEPRSPAWQAGILTTILPRIWDKRESKRCPVQTETFRNKMQVCRPEANSLERLRAELLSQPGNLFLIPRKIIPNPRQYSIVSFPASRGLSRPGKMKREEGLSPLVSFCLVVRDLCCEVSNKHAFKIWRIARSEFFNHKLVFTYQSGRPQWRLQQFDERIINT